MWMPVILILGLVSVVVLLALLFAKDPPSEEERESGQSELDRFLAEARGERGTRTASRPEAIPTARPRQRPGRPQPPVPKPTPEPDPEPEPVRIILPPEPEVVVPVDLPGQPIHVPATQRRGGSNATPTLVRLLQDRDSLQAAFLLNEILQPPRSRRPYR